MKKLKGGACVALCLAALAASTTCGAAPAGAATATGEATPARTPAVKVKNVTPNDGAVRVGVRDPIKIVFNGALDPASVTRAHVAVYSFGQPNASTVSYDADLQRIIVKPIGLAHGVTYTLVVSGLVDSSGRAVAPYQSTFATWVNPALTYRHTYRYDGSIGGRDETTFNENGFATRLVSYGDAGPDGKWRTADDGVSYYSTYDLRPDGQSNRDTSYNAPGPDGAWFTADDVVSSYTIYTYLPSGAQHTAEYHYKYESGEDVQLVTNSYDATGLMTTVDSRYAGPDGVFGTPDDDVSWVDTSSYDALGRWTGFEYRDHGSLAFYGARTWRSGGRIDYTSYYTIGPDEVAYTADDETRSVLAYTYDDRGNIVRAAHYRGAGPDGVWHTRDDVPDSYQRFWLDENDNLVKSTECSDPGPDGLWFTADDVVTGTIRYDTTR